ncbi:MAG TPA: carbon-nitrogen hydrolase family protein [Candidatus Hydrogenedentes bacterium]|nr:carbon-nitrogen hydrolase family protein [Candidatus Hydrogenedentota bacterium]HPG68397.1 carbon-nitrogen hydrolase family protein [Candidatus Hydrogenedentota bacterium]
MARPFRLAVTSIDAPSGNEVAVIDNAVWAIEEAGARGADLVLLPEEVDIVAGEPNRKQPLEEHRVFRAFRTQARKSKVAVIASLSAQAGEGFANTGFLMGRDGALIGQYRKKHPAPSEEDIVTTPITDDPFPVFSFEGVSIAIGMCMDIHFPEMFRIYGLKGADLVCLPTMYLDYTGDMLESIEKARAIDSQMYFALSRYITQPFLAGNSMGYAKVIAPDGRIIASTGHQDGVTIAEFDPKWRMPFWGEGYGGNLRTMFDRIRRPDLYGYLVRPKEEPPKEAK